MRVVLLVAIAGCASSPVAPPDAGSPPEVSGRIAHYGFDGASLASQPAGMDGVCVGCPTATAGVRGDGLAFTGAQEVSLPAMLVGVAPFTVSVWVKPTVFAGSMAAIAKPLAIDSASDTLSLRIDQSGLFGYETSAGGQPQQMEPPIGPNLFDGAWHQIVATWDGVAKADYLDGEIYASGGANGFDDGPQLVYLGDDHDTGTALFFYSGAMDELDFFDRALAPDEVKRIAGP